MMLCEIMQLLDVNCMSNTYKNIYSIIKKSTMFKMVFNFVYVYLRNENIIYIPVIQV